MTLEQLKTIIEMMGEVQYDKYIEVSFKNNYINKIPDFIWEIKNLELIDLTSNNINELDIKSLSKMRHLKTIILTNNPIAKEKVKNIREKTNLEIQY